MALKLTLAKSGIIKGGINYSKLGCGIKKWHKTFQPWHKTRWHKNLSNSRRWHKNVALKKKPMIWIHFH